MAEGNAISSLHSWTHGPADGGVNVKKVAMDREQYRLRAGIARWRNAVRRKPLLYKRGDNRTLSTRSGRTLITAPLDISIYSFGDKIERYNDTIEFLKDISKNFRRKDCFVDFSKTKRVTAAALVLVYAAIDKASALRPGKAEILWSGSEVVNRMLRINNIHRLIRGHKISFSLDSVKSMPIISSVGSEMMEEIIDYIQNKIYNDQMSPDTEHVYGDAVSETINNVRLHAYPNSKLQDKKWWLMCSVLGKKLYLAIYDTGVGIPKTVIDRPWFVSAVQITHPQEYASILEQHPGFEKEKPLLLRLIPTKISDEQLIMISMQGDVSGTKQDKHGQGSKSIMALVGDTADGVLWVFSNGGLYKFNQADKKPEMYKLPKEFPGTLVQWNIELP